MESLSELGIAVTTRSSMIAELFHFLPLGRIAVSGRETNSWDMDALSGLSSAAPQGQHVRAAARRALLPANPAGGSRLHPPACVRPGC